MSATHCRHGTVNGRLVQCALGKARNPVSLGYCARSCAEDDGPWRSDLLTTLHRRPLPRPWLRPGDCLAALIHLVTGTQPCPTCGALRANMNTRGWWWTWTHRAEIAAHLRRAAAERGLAVLFPSILSLLRAALRGAAKR